MDSKNVGNGEVINLGTGKSYSILEIAKFIGGPYSFIPKRPGEVFEVRAENKKAKKLLSWKPEVSLKEGLSLLKKEHGI
jgi:nucleoside-diphosphate-sugar epimerase